MDFGFLSKKSIAKMLNLPIDNLDAALSFASKLKDEHFNKEKGKELVNIIKKYDVNQLNDLVDKVLTIIRK